MSRTESGWIRTGARQARRGFTLVELLVVIAIIGLLAALVVPAVFAARATFEKGAVKFEVQSLDSALASYRSKYGDYPPDGSSWPVMERHFRKAFPDILNTELSLMNPANGTILDRAEALVFFLGGFSADNQRPFTGTGGPLVNVNAGTPAPPLYRYNGSRENSFYDFTMSRLTLDDVGSSGTPELMSNDEQLFAGAPTGDQFPVFMARNNTVVKGAPYVYFDSRTYFANINTAANPIFNCYQPSNLTTTVSDPRGVFGAVRPHLESVSSTGVFVFQNSKTFQIIAPGRDGKYGGRLVALGAQWFTLVGNSFTYNGTIMVPDAASTTKFALNENIGIVDYPAYDNASNFTELNTLGEGAQ